MSSQQDNLNYLAELTEASPPSFLNELSEDNLNQLKVYVDVVIRKNEAGLDKLFESMSMMMKFIPNFILHAITPKYIEPSIAARITSKLTIKQSLGVTSGLPFDYIGDTAAYLDSQHAADILSGIKKNKIEQIIAYMVNKHPLKVLDICEHFSVDILKLAKPLILAVTFDEAGLNSARRELLEKVQLL
jgi:hypothetical protein